MTNEDILNIAMEQHAIDANCSPEDFKKSESIVVLSKAHEDARRYLNLPFFCKLISYGSNIVASVDESIAHFIKKYIDSTQPHTCFESPQIHHLTNELIEYGYLPCYQAEYWLPDLDVLKLLPCQYETRLLEQEDFQGLYVNVWGNALSFTRPHLDMLGIGAYDGDRLIGLAACSADCESMWQIGVDVLPEYRKQGIASALTSQLTIEILERGKAPFYCCAWSNIGSARNAIKSGFRPAWVELTATKKDKALEWDTNKHFPLHKQESTP